MKYLIYFLMLLALVLIGFNVPVLDFGNILEGDSGKAVITIVASLCVIILMGILLVSREIAEKHS